MSPDNPGRALYLEYLADNSRRKRAGKNLQSWVQWCISAAKADYAPVIKWHEKHEAKASAEKSFVETYKTLVRRGLTT